MYDDALDNGFERMPGTTPGEVSAEQMAKAEQWEDSMGTGVPEFSGDQFGNANESNEYYGEAAKAEAESGEAYDKGISDAAALINYGLDAAAREKGVEFVVQTIKTFNASGKEDPIGDLFNAMGIDTPTEAKDVRNEALAARDNVNEFREGVNQPSQKRSLEGAFKAIEDMKELILEVEGADPRYEELRAGARAAGKGYFEYAVNSYGTRGLTELFRVLAMQREMSEAKEEEPEKEEAKVEMLDEGILGGDSIATEEGEEEKKPEEEVIKREEHLGTETLNPEILKKDAS
ncbi:hypothetical protein J6V85_01475 [Candidatus Saccharibacteria bacterium]|nr:hypothetical protein [Candidatus Saccharibacteria bacterium]